MRHPFYKGVLLGSLVAVVVMMATTALAGSGVGGVFNLGRVNTVNRTSYLTGTTAGKVLQVKNKGTGTALSLKVKAGRPPLAVNSTARVKRLNADTVDGLHAGDLGRVYTARQILPASGEFVEVLSLPGLLNLEFSKPGGAQWFGIRVTSISSELVEVGGTRWMDHFSTKARRALWDSR